MTAYVSLLRNHIAKENNILFSMADQVLTIENHASLLKDYSGVIPLTRKGGGITEYLNDIERLEKKYN
jgi:hemerythrin-like domain-containing protein